MRKKRIFHKLCYYVASALILISITPSVSAADLKSEFIIDEILRAGGIDSLPPESVDSLVAQTKGQVDKDNLLSLLTKQYEAYWKIGSYGHAVHILESMKILENESDSTRQNMQEELQYATALFCNSRYAEAGSVVYNVISKLGTSGNYIIRAEAFIILANIDIRSGDVAKAKSNLEKAFDNLCKESDGKSKQQLLVRYWLGMSTVNIETGNYQEAYDNLKNAEKCGIESDSLRFLLWMNLAIIYDYMNNDHGSESYYKKILEAPQVHYNKCIAINHYANYLIRRGRIDEAISLLKDNVPLLKKMEAYHGLAGSFTLLAEAYKSKGEYEEAFSYYNQAIENLEVILQQHNNLQHQVIFSLYDYAMLKDELMLNHRYLRYTLTGILIFQISLGLLLWYLVLRIKAARILKFNNREESISLRYLELSKNEKVKQLEIALSHRSRELVANQMKMDQIEKTFSHVMEDEDSTNQSLQVKLENVLDRVKSMKLTKRNWEVMRIYFEDIFPGFYINLENRHPNLTNGEKRMCAFIISGMNTSEIAQMCNRSVRTVESIKYKLKKKLNLTAEDSLDTYLNSLNYKSLL